MSKLNGNSDIKAHKHAINEKTPSRKRNRPIETRNLKKKF